MLQEVQLQTRQLAELQLTNCVWLRQLSFPVLDTLLVPSNAAQSSALEDGGAQQQVHEHVKFG